MVVVLNIGQENILADVQQNQRVKFFHNLCLFLVLYCTNIETHITSNEQVWYNVTNCIPSFGATLVRLDTLFHSRNSSYKSPWNQKGVFFSAQLLFIF